MPETAVWSVVMAIYALWLSAAAEGLGTGWVSILDPAGVTTILDVPAEWTFVAAATPQVPSTPGTGGPATEVPEQVTIVLRGTPHTVAYRPGDTLLETARRGGLQAPYSCESGNCATCMAVLREGTATMRANDALRADEVASGWVLTCQAVPEGHSVTVEYEAL